MTPAGLRAVMASNNLTVLEMSRILHCTERSVYLWLSGSRGIPKIVEEFLQLKGLSHVS